MSARSFKFRHDANAGEMDGETLVGVLWGIGYVPI